MTFDLTPSQRKDIVDSITAALESSYADPSELIVSKKLDEENIHAVAKAYQFDRPNDAKEVILHVIKNMKEHSVNVTHPSYFGLFNPRPSFPSAVADIINSYLNPQMAAWSHSPYACELERLVITAFAKRFGYAENNLDGTFCTGGAESNLTAVLCALQNKFPEVSQNGLIGLQKRPLIYCSSESHHSLEKAAKIVGLGRKAIRMIDVHNDLTMDVAALKLQIAKDRKEGFEPMMIVGTAGTTGAGMIDDLESIASVSAEENLWFHVDAAYGAGVIVTDLKHLLKGVEKSDSITLDLHKWFSVPMATSLFLTSNKAILHETFNVRTDYMPADGDQVSQIDPYIHSIQWSRRFIGLKIYLPLAIFGWEGYAETITHQIKMGNALRDALQKNGWTIKNESKLPVVCFTHPDFGDDDKLVEQFIERLVYSGETWLSAYPVNGRQTIRASITNYLTQLEDVEKLIKLLSRYKSLLLETVN